jgi:NAD(P)-dependent dehydrogenase (short-subunit alcohol dehydrogenase family)
MSTAPVALILGAGPRIGAAVAEAFSNLGYRIALASRKGIDALNDQGYLSLKIDFAQPDSLPSLFDAVEKHFDATPATIVYNAGALTAPPNKDSVLSIPTESVIKDFIVNTVSPYAAAQQAVERWSKVSDNIPKTFIYTGNITNVAIVPVPMFLNIGTLYCPFVDPRYDWQLTGGQRRRG